MSATMRAAVIERYGPPEVVKIKPVPMPEVGFGDVLVRVTATTVNSGDARVRGLNAPKGMKVLMRFALGFFGPRNNVGGFEAAGVVERVGGGVTGFTAGDRVVVSRGFKFRCHAEYVVVKGEAAIAKIPDHMSDADAVALLFGGATSLYFFRAAKVAAGERVLINGASGAVGVMAVQIAKHMGLHVTAVCSGANAELVASLGADEVIDYRQQDFTSLGRHWDVIMDNHGNAPYGRVKACLAPGGRFLMVIGSLFQMVFGKSNPAIVAGEDNETAVSAASYGELLSLAEAGVIRPVVGDSMPFSQIVAAHRIVDDGHKVGSLVLELRETSA